MNLDQALAPFGSSSLSYLVCETVLKIAPDAPAIKPFTSLAGAALTFETDPGAELLAVTERESGRRALWMVEGLDVGKDVFSILSGLASAVRLFLVKHQGDGPPPGQLDAFDQCQGEDAVAKLLAISWAIGTLFPGSPEEQVQHFLDLQGGQALLAWFVTVELALPLVDEVGMQGPDWLDELIERLREPESAKLSEVVGMDEVDRAWQVETLLRPHLHEVVAAREERLQTLVTQLQKRLPVLVEIGSELGGAFGGGIDALPVYHLLGARLVAEACVKGVVAEHEPEPEPEPEETEEQETLKHDVTAEPHQSGVGQAMATSTTSTQDQAAESAALSEVPDGEAAAEPPSEPVEPVESEPTEVSPPEASPPEASPPAPPAKPPSSDAAPTPAQPPAKAPGPSAPATPEVSPPEVSPPEVSPPEPQPSPKPDSPTPLPLKPSPPKPSPPKPSPPPPASTPPVALPLRSRPAPSPTPTRPSAPTPRPKPVRRQPKAQKGGFLSTVAKLCAVGGCLSLLGCTGLFAIGGAGSVLALLGLQQPAPRKIIIIEEAPKKKTDKKKKKTDKK